METWYNTLVGGYAAPSAAKRKASTYAHIQKEHWKHTAHRSAITACERYGIANAAAIADDVVAHPDHFPHFVAQQRVFCVLLHRYFVEGGRKRDAMISGISSSSVTSQAWTSSLRTKGS
jgi:hypothetical protein